MESYRMHWISLLLQGRFSEPETKNQVIATVRGHELTLEFIILSKLYHFLVYHYEIGI